MSVEESLLATMDSTKPDEVSLRAVLQAFNQGEDLDLEVLTDVEEEQLKRIGLKILKSKRKEGEKKEPEAAIEGKLKQIRESNNNNMVCKTDIKIENNFEKFSRKKMEDGRNSQKGSDEKSETGTEVKIEEKFESFLKNQKASSGGGGFSKKTTPKDPPGKDEEWKSPFKEDSTESSSDGMSTTGGMLYAAALIALKMMEK